MKFLDAIKRHIRSLEVRFNRPLLRRQSVYKFVCEWNNGESSLGRLAAARPKLLVTITTHRRPNELSRLIESLAKYKELRMPDCCICVLNDYSEDDYGHPRTLLSQIFGDSSLWLDAKQHMGKSKFWRTHQMIFSVAQAAQCEYLLSLQDDIELASDFVSRLWKVWNATGADVTRRVLYLFSSNDDEENGRWIHFARIAVPDARARRTDWFDMQGFLVDRKGLELLRYWIVPVPKSRWHKKPSESSGVGRQLTRRLRGRAATYQCDPPLIAHGGAASLMNQEARRCNPLDNRAQVFGEE
ncbi:hypothetical protein Selin_0282 [Desulfurispirillum indicum S5]|uniref:Glycosyl transferase family 2 n=1 Tax=Desulfurispirillum indicum (strain ATCC BAA-1389 / DSM 22839 / S5) TaxID=653733 RepID=E6W6N8_DESIS|nr:hypothetical protein [Desulfurispirillum indicum]ADU65038.1 hypothetical protein Selin_0282 [Desulfurispirillum indicum S5]